jgi:hypothetical protein
MLLRTPGRHPLCGSPNQCQQLHIGQPLTLGRAAALQDAIDLSSPMPSQAVRMRVVLLATLIVVTATAVGILKASLEILVPLLAHRARCVRVSACHGLIAVTSIGAGPSLHASKPQLTVHPHSRTEH